MYNCYSWAEYHQIEEFVGLCGTLSIPLNPHGTKSEATSGLPLKKGDGRGIKSGDFDLLYFITAQRAVK